MNKSSAYNKGSCELLVHDLPGLSSLGLMTMAPWQVEEMIIRDVFCRTRRLAEWLQVQERVSYDINRGFVGGELRVLVEGHGEADEALGRSYRDAPGLAAATTRASRSKCPPAS